jgi:uncharacterized protein YeaO (DUF488 family)
MIAIKRVYEPPMTSDGTRFLVDRLWPRGLKKEDAKVKDWIKEVSPGNELRHWFVHDPSKWKEFQRRYFVELNKHREAWQTLLDAAREGDITLVFSARDTKHNNAVALKNYLEKRLKTNASRRRQASSAREVKHKLARAP